MLINKDIKEEIIKGNGKVNFNLSISSDDVEINK
jgi:hypothetical protein